MLSYNQNLLSIQIYAIIFSEGLSFEINERWGSSLTTTENLSVLTAEQDAQLGDLLLLLARNPRQRVSPTTFLAFLAARQSNSSEMAILRHGPREVEIYLTQRPDDDPFYPGEWHGPGVMLFPDEVAIEGTGRTLRSEVGVGLTDIIDCGKKFEWPKGTGPGQCPRGHTVCFYHVIWPTDEQAERLTGGTWFPIAQLPEPMIEVHVRMINWLHNEWLPAHCAA